MEGLKTENLLFSLIKNEITENCGLEKIEISPKMQRELFVLSKKHDLAHLVLNSINKLNLSLQSEVEEAFKKQYFLAFYRYEQSNYEYKKICETLNAEKIPFIPLKGAVIRDYYPEPWLRTSCDIDVLVKEQDLDRAIKALVDNLGCRKEGDKNFHDVSLMFSSNVHLELHFNILENIKKIDYVLKDVWDYAYPIEQGGFEYRVENEFFIFHMLAHMSYHFVSGGCGIRPFIDLFILRNRFEIDQEKLTVLLEKGKILKFYNAVCDLCEVWFGDKNHTELTLNMQEYLLTGGVYGNLNNKIAMNKAQGDSRGKYLFKRIFLPYNSMKTRYPILKKHKWLLPFCHLHRWFERLFTGNAGKIKKEMQAYNSVSQEKNSAVEQLIKDLEI